MSRLTAVFICLCAVLALAAPTALAQSATEDAYRGFAASEQADGSDGGTPNRSGGEETRSAADDGGSLPFTGLELSLVALAGVALAGVGFAVRRASRGPAGA